MNVVTLSTISELRFKKRIILFVHRVYELVLRDYIVRIALFCSSVSVVSIGKTSKIASLLTGLGWADGSGQLVVLMWVTTCDLSTWLWFLRTRPSGSEWECRNGGLGKSKSPRRATWKEGLFMTHHWKAHSFLSPVLYRLTLSQVFPKSKVCDADHSTERDDCKWL